MSLTWKHGFDNVKIYCRLLIPLCTTVSHWYLTYFSKSLGAVLVQTCKSNSIACNNKCKILSKKPWGNLTIFFLILEHFWLFGFPNLLLVARSYIRTHDHRRSLSKVFYHVNVTLANIFILNPLFGMQLFWLVDCGGLFCMCSAHISIFDTNFNSQVEI